MDDINTQNQYMDYQPEEKPGWWSRTMSGLKSGATMYAAGTALSKVPKMGWTGNLLKGFGKFDMQTAPIYSTTQPLSDKLEDTSTPTTVKGHTKKWLRNTGKEAGISAGMWGVGKGIALAGAATANPFVAGAGTALMGLGSMGMAYSWLSPTISTAIDVWLNKRKANGQQDATTMQPKMASLCRKGNTTMNYVELVQMIKQAGAGSAERDFINKYEQGYQDATKGLNRIDRAMANKVVKPWADMRVYPAVADARDIADRNQLIAGGAAGLAGAGLTYGGLGLIPGLKKRKLIRALAAVAGGAGAGLLVGNNVGRQSFNSTIAKTLSNPDAFNAAGKRVENRIKAPINDIKRRTGFDRIEQNKKAYYIPTPPQQPSQEDKKQQLPVGRMLLSGGIGGVVGAGGVMGGGQLGANIAGNRVAKRLEKYKSPGGYMLAGSSGKFEPGVNIAMADPANAAAGLRNFRRDARIFNAVQKARGKGRVIGSIAALPLTTAAAYGVGRLLRPAQQKQQAPVA